MIGAVAVDTSTVLVLAAVALAEGIVQVPAGAVVLRRFLLGPWQVSGSPAQQSRLQLVHWWPPWTDTLVLTSSSSSAPLTGMDLQERLRATAWTCRAARVVGAVTIIVLVVGIPVSIGYAGLIGGLVAAGCMFAGQVILGALGWRGLRALGAPRPARLRLAAQTLNPFASPGVASRLLAAAVAGEPPLTIANTLLTPERWAAWFRRRAYDAGVALTIDRELDQGLAAAREAVARVLAQRPAMASDHRWCPRCAATYRSGIVACVECDVALLAATETAVPSARFLTDGTA
jgi:hypothetical protein